jgi:ABC-2 type transport system ATP-binding protein
VSVNRALRRIVLWRGGRIATIDARNPVLVNGFHSYEPAGGLRWTDGDPELPATLLGGFAGRPTEGNVKPSPLAAIRLAIAADSGISAGRWQTEGRYTVSGDSPPVLIEIDGLTKRFGSFTAVDNVTFNVARGEVLGFLGPNGAGKSTTMRMLAGFMIPTSGSARICGHDVQDDGVAARRMLGFLPEGAPTYPEMTVTGFLSFCAKIRGFTGALLKQRVQHAIELTRLDSVVLQPVETLSKGFKRRVGLAQALLHDPPVLVLDEPTDGLDPNQKHEVRALISRMAPEKAIVISTHILEEVDAVCTRAMIIARGQVVADETPAALQAKHPSGKLDDVFRQLTMEVV